MSYQNLLYPVKRRILDEVEGAFSQHPAFTDKVKVYHKFPYDERIQYGVLLRGTSATQIRLSPDNFISDLYSHVRLARQTDYPGLAIEWVRENEGNTTSYITEDVSSQVGPTQRLFFTQYPILSGPGNTKYADNIGQVIVTVNDVKTFPEYVNGEKQAVMMPEAFASSDVVKISYFKRLLSEPAIYVFDFTEDNEFLIAPIYVVTKELVIEGITGTETSAFLNNSNIDANSNYLYMIYDKPNSVPIDLIQDTDYTINLTTGELTFLTPLIKNMNLYADYRYQPLSYYNGPYTFEPYQENHEVISGVIISIGHRAKKGDRQVVIVTQFQEDQARIYGGHYEISMELSVIAKDPIQLEEMTDHIINHLWGIRKGYLEHEGLTLNSVEPSGESEEIFVETTGDVYYTHSIAINIMSEWQMFVPYLYSIRRIILNLQGIPDTKDYNIDSNNNATFIADTRTVIRYPSLGYEKLT